jgi:hypothetical protein
MKELNLIDRILSFLTPKSKTVRILITTAIDKETVVYVDAPISFSELDDKFGKGNWAL